jgi:hypothetical protein
MAFDMTHVEASPDSFKAPRNVEFSFEASGKGTLKLVYTVSTLTLDGQHQATRTHELTKEEQPFSDMFLVDGDPGQRNVSIKATQGTATKKFTVVLDLQE